MCIYLCVWEAIIYMYIIYYYLVAIYKRENARSKIALHSSSNVKRRTQIPVEGYICKYCHDIFYGRDSPRVKIYISYKTLQNVLSPTRTQDGIYRKYESVRFLRVYERARVRRHVDAWMCEGQSRGRKKIARSSKFGRRSGAKSSPILSNSLTRSPAIPSSLRSEWT